MHAGGGGSARTSVSGEQTLTDTTLLRERRHRSGEQSRGRKRERERKRKRERDWRNGDSDRAWESVLPTARGGG